MGDTQSRILIYHICMGFQVHVQLFLKFNMRETHQLPPPQFHFPSFLGNLMPGEEPLAILNDFVFDGGQFRIVGVVGFSFKIYSIGVEAGYLP